jgi:catechol 2,3-dioxygenase-like lactoylglutathione lyase family enzyme
MLKKLHHVAYRCRDARETVDFYRNVIGLKFAAALVQDEVPSIKIHCPHTHIFFEMDDGSYIAFFELLEGSAPYLPVERDWAQHLALEVENQARVDAILGRLRARGVEIVGPERHGELIVSWYFYDPTGHRMELVLRTDRQDLWNTLEATADKQLDQWEALKKAHAELRN